MNYEMILIDTRGRVGLILLNRPKAMNALNNPLMHEVMEALEAFDRQEGIGAMVITGNEKAFVARSLRDLERRGAIRIQRRQIQVVDEEILQAWSQEPEH